MKILLIDDEKDTRVSLSGVLSAAGHDVTCAKSGLEGLDLFADFLPDLVLTDIRMPEIDGLEVLRRIKQVQRSNVAVVMITGHGDEDTAITAMRLGAFDYFRKPIDVRELVIAIDHIAEHLSLRRKVAQYQEKFDSLTAEAIRAADEDVARIRKAFLRQVGLGKIGIYSPGMRAVFDLAQKYHRLPQIPVLIEGETGTGKELVARYLHFGGAETPAPFIPINCGEYTDSLFAAELFGYEGGAFTGAAPLGKKGKFDAAKGGTLFLDEIGDIPISLQPKLLRAIQEREFYRVGGLERISTDVRILCATNRNLEEDIVNGRFREDLFHRISSGRIHVPPLRERKEGIIPLAYDFLKEIERASGAPHVKISAAAERLLLDYQWPGNVRQLKNTMERAVILHEPKVLKPENLSFLPLGSLGKRRPVLGLTEFELPPDRFDIEPFNLAIVQRALDLHSGNQTKTARYLGITRKALQSRLKKLSGKGPQG
jgi:DNA-binding NtrC family response regulator